MKKRIPTSVTRIGRFTVRIYDEQAYQANIRQYYAGDDRSVARCYRSIDRVPFEKKKPSARFDWASWREPMIKEELA